MQLSVVRAARGNEMNEYPGTLTIDRSSPVAISLLIHPASDGKLRVTTVKLTPTTYAPIRTATTMRLRASSEIDTTFALSQMNAVSRTLDRCVLDLRQVWHVGEHAAKLKQAAVNLQPLQKLFSSDDYPSVALHNDGTGTVQAMLLISEAGRIASCMVTETSGHASLDAQTCIILSRRARFNPAIGPDGKPAKSATTARIRWKT
jgi:TonB family protein